MPRAMGVIVCAAAVIAVLAAALGADALAKDWSQWLEEMKAPSAATRIDRPFHVVGHKQETVTLDGGSRIAVQLYDLTIPYRDIEGQAAAGRAQLMVPPELKTPAPIVLFMHYQVGLAGGAPYFAKGWAVMTPRQSAGLYSDSINLDLAMIQAARAMPFIDGTRTAITGASAGGYVTLMTASEAFPVAAAAPNVPLVNIAYNTAYFAKNKGCARCGEKDAQGKDASLVPVFCFIADAVVDSGHPLGDPDRDAANYVRDSPVGVMDLITCPVQFQFSTADTLVPVNQVDAQYAYPTPASFPPGFTFDMDKLVPDASARITLLEALKGRSVEVFRFKPPDGLTPFWEKATPADAQATRNLSVPFSKTADFSVVVIDEGAPDPRMGHLKYHLPWAGPEFILYWLQKERAIEQKQLTIAKLRMLMRRFKGDPFEGLENHTSNSGALAPMNRRNHPGKERLDVILGLRAYCEICPEYETWLRRLYARLLPGLRALDANNGKKVARFEQDASGGLAFHEAVVHYRWGDREQAIRLARWLMQTPGHEAYAACLPEGLVRDIRGR